MAGEEKEAPGQGPYRTSGEVEKKQAYFAYEDQTIVQLVSHEGALYAVDDRGRIWELAMLPLEASGLHQCWLRVARQFVGKVPTP